MKGSSPITYLLSLKPGGRTPHRLMGRSTELAPLRASRVQRGQGCSFTPLPAWSLTSHRKPGRVCTRRRDWWNWCSGWVWGCSGCLFGLVDCAQR